MPKQQSVLYVFMNKYIKNLNLFVIIFTEVYSFGLLSAVTGNSPAFAQRLEIDSNADANKNSINLEIFNESKWAEVESVNAIKESGSTLLNVNLDLSRASYFPSGLHVHLEIFDHNGDIISSFYQYIRHRHHFSRYLGHRHRVIFIPERIEVDRSDIGKIKVTSHTGK